MAADIAASIQWAERDMPVLRAIRERIEGEKPFEGLRISACMHVTAETANLARTLKAGGADLVMVAADPHSTQDEVAASLGRDLGIPVHAARGEDEATQHRHIVAALDHRPHLILDDAAALLEPLRRVASNELADLAPEIKNWASRLSAAERTGLAETVIAGLESTAVGVTQLGQRAADGLLPFPVVAVHEAQTRHRFDSRYGTGQSTLDTVIRLTDTLIAGLRVVVAGYGWCGKGIAMRARGLGAHVVVTEVDPVRALEAIMDGFDVRELISTAKGSDLFITATGTVRVVRSEHFAVMRDGAIVCNAGHSGEELAIADLEALAKAVTKGVRESVDEYVLSDGRRVFVLGEGRSLSLAAAHGHPARIMDLSLSTLALVAEWVVKKKGKLDRRLYTTPREIDQWVARLKLERMGFCIDSPTDEQTRYPATGESHPGQ